MALEAVNCDGRQQTDRETAGCSWMQLDGSFELCFPFFFFFLVQCTVDLCLKPVRDSIILHRQLSIFSSEWTIGCFFCIIHPFHTRPNMFLVSTYWMWALVSRKRRHHIKTSWYTVYKINIWCFRTLENTMNKDYAHEDAIHYQHHHQ